MEIEYFENYKTYQESMKERRMKVLEDKGEMDSKEKIIKILELEYEDLEKQQRALFYSNEEMLLSDPNDLELIECRAENMKFIDKNFQRMKEIKEELINLEPQHFIKDKDIMTVEKFDKKEEVSENENKISIDANIQIKAYDNVEDDIIKEIDL